MLLHEVGNAEDEFRVEGRGFLDLSVLVVDDRTMQTRGGELVEVEILDQSTVKRDLINSCSFWGDKGKIVTHAQEILCFPVVGMNGRSGRVSRM